MYSTLYRRIIFPIMELYKGTKVQQYLKWLNKTQWWSPQQLENLQNKKLRALIKHAYENVPYYHRMFRKLGLKPEDIKTKEDLSKLPILTKEDIKRNYPNDIKAKNYSNKAILPWSSSGSTGEPVQFFRDKLDLSLSWAAAFRGWSWAGYQIGDKYATLWGSLITLSEHKKLVKRVLNLLRRNLLLSAFDMTEENLEEYVNLLIKFNPKFIRGYSQAIFLLARYLEAASISDIRPVAVLTTAETLFNDQRKLIEKQFGCEVYDAYGGGEAPAAAYECEEHIGYHVSAENMIVEFVRDGENVAPGEIGKIVVTNLNSYASPFIRYEMGDIGKPSDEKCPCGRGLPLISSIEGRINDFVVTPEGKVIHSYFFPGLFKDFYNIKQFQVIQRTVDKLLIKIVAKNELTKSEEETILQKIRGVVGRNMEIEVVQVDSIPPTRSGKRRFVISNVLPPF